MIVDKQNKIVPLKLNSIQRLLAKGMTNRDIVLKSRQVGISTLILARFYLEAITKENLACAVVAHEKDATKKLFDKVKVFHQNFSKLCQEEGIKGPELFRNSAEEMSFPHTGSTIYIGTAGMRAFGHGATLHRVHCSEVAYWPDDRAETILAGIEEACPLSGYLVLESTPNGMGGLFYHKVQQAIQKQGIYMLHFCPWWLHEEYFLPHDSPYALPDDRGALRLTPEEQNLSAQYNLTEDQIRWRRRKVEERGLLYPQEYPEDKYSCFLGSQSNVFNLEVLKVYLQGVRTPPVVRQNGLLRIWQLPKPTAKYIIGADTSTGEAFSRSAAFILNAKTSEHVATYCGKAPPDVFAEILTELGKEYNNALLAVERNFTGHSVLNSLFNRIGYPNLYHMTKKTFVGKETRLGWDTNKATKPHMLGELRTALASYGLITFDEMFISELLNYIYLEGTAKTGAKEGTDDIVMAAMIALAVQGESPTISGNTESTSESYID